MTNLERIRPWLPLLTVVAAVLCVAELVWLRTVQFTPTRFAVGLLFLPWLFAAATNLALWHSAIARSRPSPLRRWSAALLWVTASAFAAAFALLYSALLFGWLF